MDDVTFLVILGIATLVAVVSLGFYPRLQERRWARLDRQAVARAERLVRMVLTQAERKQLEQSGYLEVPSQIRRGRLYRVPARPGLVEQIEPDGRRRLLCLEPLVTLPPQEVVLVHKFWIEGDEEQYLRLANRMPLWADMTNLGGRQ